VSFRQNSHSIRKDTVCLSDAVYEERAGNVLVQFGSFHEEPPCNVGQILCSVVVFLHEECDNTNGFGAMPCSVARSFRIYTFNICSLWVALITCDVRSTEFQTIYGTELVTLYSVALLRVIVKAVAYTGKYVSVDWCSVKFELYPTWSLRDSA